MLSADGFFADTNGGTGWFVTSDDLTTYSLELLNGVDAILYGGDTYRMMADFWPDPPEEFLSGSSRLPEFARRTNEIPKLVVTKDKETPWGEWDNATPTSGPLDDVVHSLENGQTVVVYGSGTIVRQLTDLGLVDEYRLIVNPIVLGSGIPLFGDTKTVALELTGSQRLSSGALANRYVPLFD